MAGWTWVMLIALIVGAIANFALLFDKTSPAATDSWQLPMFAALIWTTALWLKDEPGTHDARHASPSTPVYRSPDASPTRAYQGELRYRS